jgi:hypothetical protein
MPLLVDERDRRFSSLDFFWSENDATMKAKYTKGDSRHQWWLYFLFSTIKQNPYGFSGSGGGTRTPDTRIMIPLL